MCLMIPQGRHGLFGGRQESLKEVSVAMEDERVDKITLHLV